MGLITSSIFLSYCREASLSKNIPEYLDTIKKEIDNIKNSETTSNMLPISEDKKATIIDKPNHIVSTEDDIEDDIEDVNENENEKKEEEVINWKFWMKKSEFYVYMAVYMFIRLAVNITNSMIPFYCKNILIWNREDGSTPIEISIMLIITNVASVLNSLIFEDYLMKKFKARNRRIAIFSIAFNLLDLSISFCHLY